MERELGAMRGEDERGAETDERGVLMEREDEGEMRDG